MSGADWLTLERTSRCSDKDKARREIARHRGARASQDHTARAQSRIRLTIALGSTTVIGPRPRSSSNLVRRRVARRSAIPMTKPLPSRLRLPRVSAAHGPRRQSPAM